MKKLIGLVVLAAVPVACGTVPTAPETDAVAPSSSEGTFAPSGRGRAVALGCSADEDWSTIKGIVLSVTRRGQDSVTVRAELLVIADVGPTPCFTPVFTVKPSGRGISLAEGKDPQEVTLTAPGGFYQLTATPEDQRDGMIGKLIVQIPAKGRR